VQSSSNVGQRCISRRHTLKFAAPTWALVFDYYDPGRLRFALDVRHPLADVRIIRFALGLPAVPWCIDKHLLRRCLNELPVAVQTRPKTPVRGDPVAQRFRMGGLGSASALWRGARGLEAFVDGAAVERLLLNRSLPAAQLTSLLRVVSLALWLEAQSPAYGPRFQPRTRVRKSLAPTEELP
jgi:hypothetical protein